MKSLIFGYGQTGKSFEKYLKNKNISFDIYDDDKSKLPEADQEKNIPLSLNNLKETINLILLKIIISDNNYILF